MQWGEVWAATRRAARALTSAGQTSARGAGRVGAGTTRVVHRMTRASGAGRTGLSSLIELTAVGSAGDAFVAVALAGTLFFSVSLDQARWRVALALLLTMAPFAVLAPLIGPMLDRVQQGRRYLLAGTLLARGLLCWAMSGAVLHNDAVTLLPAAFGVLVLQKAYGVSKAAVTPRLLPDEITLVTANARTGMASLVASTLAAVAAAGVDVATGAGVGGAAWVLRAGTAVYLAGVGLSFRVPERVDTPEPQPVASAPVPSQPGASPRGPTGTRPLPSDPPSTATGGVPSGPGTPGRAAAAPGGAGAARGGAGGQHPAGVPRRPAGQGVPGQGVPAQGVPGQGVPGQRAPGQRDPGQRDPGQRERGRREPGRDAAEGQRDGARPNGASRWRTLRRVGPVVGEAMRANATLRAFSGFMVFFLAFLLRIEHFPGVNDKVALTAMIASAAAGGFLGTAVGSSLRARRPHLITFGMLAIATAITALCAVFYGLWAALVVSLVAAFGQVLGKLALDSTVQHQIGEEIRSSTFAASETLHQLSWVAGGLAGLAMSLTSSGIAGLTVAAVGLAVSLVLLLGQRRRRSLETRHARTAAVS